MWTAGVAAGPIENGRSGASCTAIGMGDGKCTGKWSPNRAEFHLIPPAMVPLLCKTGM